jgi:hypothetical protein
MLMMLSGVYAGAGEEVESNGVTKLADTTYSAR